MFWTYLWQLKDYHLGRFIDHFRTEKGKKIFFNEAFLFKVVLLLLLIFRFSILILSIVIFLLLAVYFSEALLSVLAFSQKKLKRPVFTKKIIFLFLVLLILLFLFLFFLNYIFSLGARGEVFAVFYLLLFDIVTPLIVSAVILLFQPLSFLAKYLLIEKAKRKRRAFKDLLVIGITGSYGKTSTKEFLAEILSQKFRVLKTKEHQNSEIGISQSILKDLKKEHQIFIAEMGAYNRGGIKLLCQIAEPKIGILTGINEQHMATFGSQQNIIKAKFELIEGLKEDGIAILNDSSPKIKNEKLKIKNYNPKLKNIKFCSINEKENFWAEDVKTEKESLSFKIFSKDGDWANFKLNLLGVQNVESILLAACCAKELGMKLGEISLICQKFRPEQGGMILLRGKNGLNIVDSSYSSNPSGVLAHLEYLKIWGNLEGRPSASYGARKAIIMPCLIELGSASKEVHYRIGEKIGQVCNLAIITTKDRLREIREGAIKEGMKAENIIFLENPGKIKERIADFKGENDIVLLEGRVNKEIIGTLIKE